MEYNAEGNIEAVYRGWQGRRDLNPRPSVLESGKTPFHNVSSDCRICYYFFVFKEIVFHAVSPRFILFHAFLTLP